MGMERAKSLLCVRRGLSFLDIIARQVLHLREAVRRHAAAAVHELLPHLGRHDGRARALRGPPVEGLPLEFLQNREPKLLADDLMPGRPGPRTPTSSGARPATATSTPRCAAPACWRGCSTPATATSSSPTPTTSARCPTRGWPAGSRRAGRRSRSRPCAVRPRTARAATSPAARPTAASCCASPRRRSTPTRTRWPTSTATSYCSTNNLWFDLQAMVDALDAPRRHPRPAADPQRQAPSTRPTVDARGHPDRDGDGRRDRGVRGRAARSRSAATGSSR